MFGMLKEASQYMSKLRRWRKQKSSGAKKPDSLGLTDRTSARSSHHFGVDYGGYKMEPHKHKSKDCYVQLREAIQEGLAKHNSLPKLCYLDTNTTTNKFDLSMGFSSTSCSCSSPSSMFHLREFDASDTSFRSSFDDKAKGLTYDHPKPSTFQESQQRQLGNHKKTTFLDMDLPKKPKMAHFCVEKVDSSPQTILFQEEPGSNHRKQLSRVDVIVIIKPKKVSGSGSVEEYNFGIQEIDSKSRNLILDNPLFISKVADCAKDKSFVQYKGIKDMRLMYHKSTGEILAEDLRGKTEVVNGGWDLGWRSGGGFNGNEVEGIVVSIQQQIFNAIIHEMIADVIIFSN